MKRTFAVIGFSYMLGLVLLNYIFTDNCVHFIAVFVVIFLLSLLIKPIRMHKELPVAIGSILLSSVIFFIVSTYISPPVTEFAEEKCHIEAQVTDYPTMSSGGNYTYLIKTETVNGNPQKLKMFLYTPYDICAEPYDRIEFSSYPFILGGDSESYERYYRSKGVYLGAYTKYDVFLHKNDSKPLMWYFKNSTQKSKDMLEDFLDKEKAGFATAILFGDKALIPDETLEDFSRTGAAHILAVSGLHMSVWVFGLYSLLKRLRVKEKTSGIICIALSFILVCLASFSPSVMRSALMTTLFFCASLFRRKADSINSLGAAAFVLCLVNPYAVCSVSFLMTVFATLGIILSADLRKLPEKRLKRLKGGRLIYYITVTVMLSLSATLFVYPISVNIFGTVSTLGWLTNLLILPLLAPCMLLCGVLTAYPGISFIAIPVSKLLNLIIDYITGCVRLIADIPGSFIETESIVLCRILPVIVASGIFLVYNIRKKRFSVSALACLLSITVITVFI